MPNLLAVHRAHLERFRHTTNLVGPGPLDLHFDDCAAALAHLQPRGRWADLGAGAGFPGLVFAALFPGVQLELVDSRRKRCLFLQGVLDEARPPRVQVRQCRVERLDDGAYDGLLARAFAKPPVVVVQAERLLRPGGLLVLFLNQTQEVDHPALEVERVLPYTVVGKDRKVVWLRKPAVDA